MWRVLPALTAAVAVLTMPPQEPGECGVVRGRLDLWNGAPSVRIWVVGTHRMLGVAETVDGVEALPPAITRIWEGAADRWEVSIFGDFKVCAVTHSRPGRMQSVRVLDAQRLVTRQRR